MLERNGGIIRAVAWSEIFPWLGIFRSFRLAIGFRVLVMGAVAILLTTIGWNFFGRVFFGTDSLNFTDSTAWVKDYVVSPWDTTTMIVPDRPVLLGTSNPMAETPSVSTYGQLIEPVFYPFYFLNRPLKEGLAQEFSFKSVTCLVFCGLWSLAIWAFFGAAICRIASVQLATSERIGWGTVLRHSCTKYPAYLMAPIIPLIGVALAVLPVFLFGLLMNIPGVGVFISAIFWPLLLIAGLIMTLLLLGLFFGWPLMWGTISTEGTDSFDALSRSYAYVFQRPLHYLFYAVVASVFGWLGWLVVRDFAAGIIWMTYWAASCGTNIDVLMPGADVSGMKAAGVWLIHFWTGCVKLLAVGFLFSYFWTASVSIYFLLRRTVDATEMDEVFLDADDSERTYALPKIVTEDSGAPVVAEGGPAVTPDSKPQTDTPPESNPRKAEHTCSAF